MRDANASRESASISETVARAENLVDKIVEEGRLGQTQEERRKSKAWVEELADQVLRGEIQVGEDTDAAIGDRIKQLDELISNQLNRVMHAQELQKLEASWRGLHYFVENTETSLMLKIKVLNVSKKELLTDLQKAVDFDLSGIFEKVHGEYGSPGGEPYGALVGDYEITRDPQDVELIGKLSNVAAAAHAPFITAASPALLNLEKFTDLAARRDLAKIFDNEAYTQWKMFRMSEDSKYIGLCLPHILVRLTYGKDTVPVEEFGYEEGVDGSDHSKYLWGNAAYAFATRITNAFARNEWCAAIRGAEGGVVEGLPVNTFQTDVGDVALECSTDIAITNRRGHELATLGFIPLCYDSSHKGTSVFFEARSANQATHYLNENATANALWSSQLQYVFAVSRFAHFLKSMMRDKAGSFMSREQCEKFLNNWISHYVLLDDFSSQDAKAKYPLRDARIEVSEHPANPGIYKAVAFLRPHFQLEELGVSLRLVARLSQPKS
jgi:type VI secretion system protein ImpC